MSQAPLVLVLEDEALIGLMLESDLADAGYKVSGTFASCASALASVRLHTPDLAIVDTQVKDGTCEALAVELMRLGVPFVVYSGTSSDDHILPVLNAVPWVEKPARSDVLLSALGTLKGRAGGHLRP